MRIWALNAGVQRPEREAYHSLPSSVEVMWWCLNTGTIPSLLKRYDIIVHSL